MVNRKSRKNKRETTTLRFLYHTTPGRIVLKGLSAPAVSRVCGAFLDSSLSKPLIRSFVKKNKINLSEFESQKYRCFNDCFTRKIKPELRKADPDSRSLIAPCDGLLSAYRIDSGTVLPIKQSSYTISDLLNGDPAVQVFNGGIALVFRLCVDHYHRYCYPDNGTAQRSVFVPGKLHTVRPIALETLPVFTQNSREYTLMHTENFGTVCQIEIGAMLVGKIKNHKPEGGIISRGVEKGMFLYGGSTVVLLLEKEAVKLQNEFFTATEKGEEVPVRMGQALGQAAR